MSDTNHGQAEAIVTFDALPLHPDVRQAVDDLGYVHPTPVQRAVYDPASRGRDLVVQARTGTGKTAAFGLAIINSVIRKAELRVQALVLCPTRELALQVARELETLGKYRGVLSVAVYGGAPMPGQVRQLAAGVHILVGTPGRILDHLHHRTLELGSLRVLVLDESDEMLSMGFLPQINEILTFLPETRQTLLFSATLPQDIRRMAETRLRDPEFITLSGDHVGALEVDHFVYMSYGDKVADFLKVLEMEDPESAIIFCNTREQTKRLAGTLAERGYSADWLNADLPQTDREKVMSATRSGQLRLLVATDVAARGIDISHLSHVMNFDFPESAEVYVHRTGRTGRAGRAGSAVSMIAPADVGNLYMLRLTYKIRPIEKQLPSEQEQKSRAETDVVNTLAELFTRRHPGADDLALARRLLTHAQADAIVAGLLRDHLAARPTLPEQATIARRARRPAPVQQDESPRQPPPGDDSRAGRSKRRRRARPEPSDAAALGQSEPKTRRRRGRPPSGDNEPPGAATGSASAPDQTDTATETASVATPPAAQPPAPPTAGLDQAAVYVNVGRSDGATADDFLRLLAERAGIPTDVPDYVRIRPRHTFVGIRRDLLAQAIDALNGATIAGKQAAAAEARSSD
jgi:ATP-dependent RNA helicase DeaD